MSNKQLAKSKLSGGERAAIFLMTLGEDEAASVLRHLGPREVQKLGTAMTALKNVSREQVNEVLTEFVRTVSEHTALGVGNTDYIRKVLVKALGEDRANSIIDRILMGGSGRGLEQLKWLDVKTIAEMLRLEHPQIIAIVLAYLDSDQSAQVLAELPARTRHDIIMRIATLDGVQPQALQELDEILERQFSGKQRLKSSTIGGLHAAANILNNLDSTIERSIMESIDEIDSELRERIQDLMFVFGDLADLDDRSIQTLLREVSTDTLVVALKGADDRMKAKVMKNLSKRAAEMLEEDLATHAPVRVSEVDAAQKEILAIAKRLADEGEIVLSSAGDEYV